VIADSSTKTGKTKPRIQAPLSHRSGERTISARNLALDVLRLVSERAAKIARLGTHPIRHPI